MMMNSVNVSRRTVVKHLAVGTAAILTSAPSWPLQRSQANEAGTELRAARKKLAWRKRPLILDDDGDLVYANETLQGPEAFLSLRMHDCRDAGIDSVAWCMMWGIAVQGRTPTRYWQTQLKGIRFQENMPDPTPVVAQFCRENGIEVFGSMRMNDCHDAIGLPFPKLVYPLKAEHPELLIGDESQRGGVEDGLQAAMWSGLDFAHEKVREDRLKWVANTARNYELDGIDMNFFRMPWYFKLGEEQQHMPLMTDFVRQSRQRLDEISRQRGKPVLLGVRVPDTVESCNRIGLDIETWLREGLVDRMLTGGGYVCYSTPAEELVQLGHRFEVPVYPCINCPANYTLGKGSLRAAASNLWWAGADGIYLWNYQYIPAPGALGYGRPAHERYQTDLPEIADPQRLKYLDKSFAVNERWWEQYQRASGPAPLPLTLGSRAGEKKQGMPVRIGDDVPGAVRGGKLRDATLRLQSSGAVAGDELAVEFNGAVAEVSVAAAGGLEQRLPPTAVKQGINQLHLAIARRGPSAAQPIVITGTRVDVRYRA
jgi:hypothetical protein